MQLKQTVRKKPFTLAIIPDFTAVDMDLTAKIASLEDDAAHLCKNINFLNNCLDRH